MDLLKSEQSLLDNRQCVCLPIDNRMNTVTILCKYRTEEELNTQTKTILEMMPDVLFLSSVWTRDRRHSEQSESMVRRFSTGSTSTAASSVYDAQTKTPDIPSWADPVKVKNHPEDYAAVSSLLTTHPSLLFLPYPVVFYMNNSHDQNYVTTIQSIGTCTTLSQFGSYWSTFRQNIKPTQLRPHQNIFCFLLGVQPMWEDSLNQKGGRLLLNVSHGLDDISDYWICAFAGGNLMQSGVVGVVINKRPRGDRIELWLNETVCEDNIDVVRQQLTTLTPYHYEITQSMYKKHL